MDCTLIGELSPCEALPICVVGPVVIDFARGEIRHADDREPPSRIRLPSRLRCRLPVPMRHGLTLLASSRIVKGDELVQAVGKELGSKCKASHVVRAMRVVCADEGLELLNRSGLGYQLRDAESHYRHIVMRSQEMKLARIFVLNQGNTVTLDEVCLALCRVHPICKTAEDLEHLYTRGRGAVCRFRTSLAYLGLNRFLHTVKGKGYGLFPYPQY